MRNYTSYFSGLHCCEMVAWSKELYDEKEKTLQLNLTPTANTKKSKERGANKRGSTSQELFRPLPKDPPKEHWQTLKLLFENVRQPPAALHTKGYFIRYTISNTLHALDACHLRIKSGSKAYDSNASSTAYSLRKSIEKNFICCTDRRWHFSVQRQVFWNSGWEKVYTPSTKY